MPIIVKPIKELSKKIEPSRWSAVFEPLDRRSPLVQVAGRYVLSSCDQRLSSNSHGHGDHKWGTVKCTNAPAKLVMFTVVIVQYCVIMFIKFKIRVNIEASTFDLFSLATKMLLRYYVVVVVDDDDDAYSRWNHHYDYHGCVLIVRWIRTESDYFIGVILVGLIVPGLGSSFPVRNFGRT